MVQTPTVYIKLAQLEYYAGDSVSGEVVLNLPFPLNSGCQLTLIIWCEESCEWEEGMLQSRIGDNEFQSKFRRRYSALVSKENVNSKLLYQGNHVNYICRTVIWDSQNKPVAAGNYIIPFGFTIPSNASASCRFMGEGWKLSVQHKCFIALHEGSLTSIPKETKKIFLRPIMDDLLCRTDHDLLGATNLISFVVVEKPLHQAALKSYIFQCSYSIGSLFFEKAQLTLTIKKNSQGFLPGEIVPIVLEIINQTKSNIFSIFVTLRNIITLKSSAGIYKEIVHPICRLAQPLNIPGNKSETCEQICIPFPLPIGVAPTCHGVTVSNEWDFLISCNYKQNLGISMKYTEQDLNVPLCIWPTTVHPSKTYYNITRNSLFNNNIQLSDIHEDTSPSQMSLLPVLQKDKSVTLLPTQVFKIDYDIPAPKEDNITRLTFSKLSAESSKELVQTLQFSKVFFQYEMGCDSGAILSDELQNSFHNKNLKQSKRIKILPRKQTIPRAKRVITPIQE